MSQNSLATVAAASSLSPLARPFTFSRSASSSIPGAGAGAGAGAGGSCGRFVTKPAYSTAVTSARIGEVNCTESAQAPSYAASSSRPGEVNYCQLGNYVLDDAFEARTDVQLGSSAMSGDSLMNYNEHMAYGYEIPEEPFLATNLNGCLGSSVAIAQPNTRQYHVFPCIPEDLEMLGPNFCPNKSPSDYVVTTKVGHPSLFAARTTITNQLSTRNNTEKLDMIESNISCIKRSVNEFTIPGSIEGNLTPCHNKDIHKGAARDLSGCSTKPNFITKPTLSLPSIAVNSFGSSFGDLAQNSDEKSLDSPCWPGKNVVQPEQPFMATPSLQMESYEASELNIHGEGTEGHTLPCSVGSEMHVELNNSDKTVATFDCLPGLIEAPCSSRKFLDVLLKTIHSHTDLLLETTSHNNIGLMEDDRLILSSVINNLQSILHKTGKDICSQSKYHHSSKASVTTPDVTEHHNSIVLHNMIEDAPRVTQNHSNSLFALEQETMDVSAYKNLWRNAELENLRLKLQLERAYLNASGANSSLYGTSTGMHCRSHGCTKPTVPSCNNQQSNEGCSIHQDDPKSFNLALHRDHYAVSVKTANGMPSHSNVASGESNFLYRGDSELSQTDWEHVRKEELVMH